MLRDFKDENFWAKDESFVLKDESFGLRTKFRNFKEFEGILRTKVLG